MYKREFNVLVCPLNWGLGHATRCIPVIHELQKQGCKVIIAADGQALKLLRSELPDLEFIKLPDVSIRYHKKSITFLTMISQIPAILRVIRREHTIVDEIVKKQNIAGVVSDNRYGCFSHLTESVIITHQLRPLTPWYLKPTQPFIARWVADRLSRFDQVWIPDTDAVPGFSGSLSTNRYQLPAVKTGLLSRLQTAADSADKKQVDVLAILGGPEPQRTVFENILLQQMRLWPDKNFVLLRGLPGLGHDSPPVSRNIRLIPHCNPREFASLVSGTKHLVARSGYSTIMDLATLGRSACLVPTPGQSEQEYLADHMIRMGWFTCQRQSNFDLSALWSGIQPEKGLPIDADDNKLPAVIAAFMDRVDKKTAPDKILILLFPNWVPHFRIKRESRVNREQSPLL